MHQARDPEGILAWLERQDPTGDSGVDGFDVRLWEDSTWVLHAMYETVYASDSANTPGVVLASGFTPQTERGIRRIRWRDRVDLRAPLDGSSPENDFSLTLDEISDLGDGEIAPPRGTLDSESLRALVEVVSRWMCQGQEARVHCFYSAAKGDLHSDFEGLRRPDRWELLLDGSVRDFVDMLRLPGGIDFTPTNMWPESKAWFLWTPHESVATKVSGPSGLIEAIREDPRLECFDQPKCTLGDVRSRGR